MNSSFDNDDGPTSTHLPAATHAAALSVEVRSPLAQIELAASQLFREALTPNARNQAEQIFRAVAEIDELVERMRRVLVPPRTTAQPQVELGAVLNELRHRFVPALGACKVEWRTRDVAPEPVYGDASQVRRQCTELLHLAMDLTGEGGQFTLVLSGGEGRVEASLFCRRARPFSQRERTDADAAVKRCKAAALEGGAKLCDSISKLTSDVRLEIPNSTDETIASGTRLESAPGVEAPCRES